MLERRATVDALMPARWIAPFPLACFAAAWILLADVQVILTTYPTRHTIVHIIWNHTLLATLLLLMLSMQIAGRLLPLRHVGTVGLSLAALGLAGRAVVEVALTCIERWPPHGMATDATPILMADATRWIGLAAFAVGLTLFAVEIAGWWVDRRRQRR